MDEELERVIREALLLSWSAETSFCYSKDGSPSYGQCAPTAIVIQENFGGDILKTDGWPRSEGGYGCHFYNRIDGMRYDFTAGQFTEMSEYTWKIEYKDQSSSVEEAATEASPNQIESMRTAFERAYRPPKDNKKVNQIFDPVDPC